MNEPLKRPVKAAIIALIVLVVVLCIVLVMQRQRIQHFQTVNEERTDFDTLLHKRTLTSGDTSYIQSWMTFDYVDTVFKVPADYLKTALDVNNPQYPRITIGRYAQSIGTSTQGVTALVQNAVSSYLANEATTTMMVPKSP